MSILDRILATKHEEVARLRAVRLPSPPALRPLGLKRAPGEALRIISEIKFRSPSAGPLSTALGVSERAAAYSRAGASMLSVLCDQSYFDGDFEHLSRARDASSLPILCKEFVIDEVQLDAARAFGADAVLIIVRCLTPERLAVLIAASRQRGLEPFVEIANEEEAKLALDAGAALVGVNARDLDTLKMNAERASRCLELLPQSVVSAHFSGLHRATDIAAVAKGPAHAALVGEALMRQDDPTALLTELVAAASMPV